MKKLFLLSITIIAFTLSANSQEIADNALGLRLGDSDGFGAEISYQRALSDYNRLEFGLGWRDKSDYSAIRAVGLYQWVWQLDGNFNWYAGVGANTFLGDPFQLGVLGEVGIEYHFNGAPIALGADWRPHLNIIEDTNFSADNFGFNARFVF